MTDHERAAERERMVEHQLRRRGIENPRTLRALSTVPRHLFVPPEIATEAYDDGPVGIGCGQTISQPLMVATMTDALDITPGDHILEVGVGSGYQTAVLLEVGARVTGVERHGVLARDAETRLHSLGYRDFDIRVADGSLGCPDAAPFDGVLVAAAAPAVPSPLVEQLAPGGRLVVPVGDRKAQTLLCLEKQADGSTERFDLGAVVFVPLIGAGGFDTA
jgi:protein-L-isoaspartate(D-aspartate) O-methyltransferase